MHLFGILLFLGWMAVMAYLLLPYELDVED